MNVHIIRTPESQGRPEKYIVDQVVEQLRAWMPPHSNLFEHDPNGVEKPDPANGSSFYSIEPAIRMLEVAAHACHNMADGDCVFIADAQAPVAPIISYLTRLKGITVRMTGLFHSSSYTPGDMFYDNDQAMDTETLTLGILDRSFAATEYLAQHLYQLTPPGRYKTMVTRGLPMDHVTEYLHHRVPESERQRVCVWPHRVAEDKGLEFMLELADNGIPIKVLTPTVLEPELAKRLTDAGCSIQHCPTKDDYFRELGRAKVVLSTAVLETFGYAMIEGTVMGCTPVVPDRACYSEQYMVRSKYEPECLEDCLRVTHDALAGLRPHHTGLKANQSDFRGVAKRMAQAILG